jgi:very-short-patch-repair endonuclease
MIKHYCIENCGQQVSRAGNRCTHCSKIGSCNPFFGKSHSEKTKAKIRSSKYHSTLKGANTPFFGRKHTKAVKDFISKNNTGKKLTLAQKKRHKKAINSFIHTAEYKEKQRLAQTGKKRSKATIAKLIANNISRKGTFSKVTLAKHRKNMQERLKNGLIDIIKKANTGRKTSKATKKKLSVSSKKRWEDLEYRKKQRLIFKKRWKNEEYRNKVARNSAKTNGKHKINKKEKILKQLLDKLLFKKYIYVGSSSKIVINGFRPDFICEKEKKIIELYGDYWHRKIDIIKRDKCRVASYKKHGYALLVVWEKELKDLNKLTKKILKFDKKNFFKL